MVERASWTVWRDIEVNVSQRTYSTRVAEAGGLPRDPAARRGVRRVPEQLLDLLDGLVLAGGADIDPAAYGADPDPRDEGLRGPSATASSWRSRAGALERDMPVLGICRGMQLLNVACGGTLDQHLADAGRRTCTRPGDVLRPRRPPRARLARGARGRRRARLGALAPPPGRRPARRRARRDAAGPIRATTVEAIELPGPALGARRPLAHRGGAPKPGARGADRGGGQGGGRRDRGRRARDRARSWPRCRGPGVEETDAAVAAAKAAFPGWRDVSPADRAALMRRLADAIEAEAERAGDARGPQRRQADRRRARRDRDGRRVLPLLRRRARAAARPHDPGRRRRRHDLPRTARRRRR